MTKAYEKKYNLVYGNFIFSYLKAEELKVVLGQLYEALHWEGFFLCKENQAGSTDNQFDFKHGHRYTLETFQKLLVEAKFTIILGTYWTCFLDPMYIIIAQK